MQNDIQNRIKSLRDQYDMFYINITKNKEIDDVTRENLIVQYILRADELNKLETIII